MSQIPPSGAKRVLAFGTFDQLHAGHRSFLRQARRLGAELIVVVARDRNVEKLKGTPAVQDEETRRTAVARLPFVTKAILGQPELRHRYGLIRELKPDVVALGYDQFLMTHELEADLKKLGLNVALVRCKAFNPERYKSSLLRKAIAK